MSANYQLYENAKKRIRQRKRLYYHFVVFAIGVIFLLILNKLFNIGEDTFSDWSYYVIGIWFFFWCLHFSNVYITHRFMNKEWEFRETERLIQKQEAKLAEIAEKIQKKYDAKKKALEDSLTPSKKNSNPPS